MVYPGDMKVIVELNNGPIICSEVTAADTSCTVTLPRDIYNISITQSNDIGSTVDSASFDSECALLVTSLSTNDIPIVAVLVVSEQISLMLNTQLLFIVTVRRNEMCPETKSPVLVTFGTRAVVGGECEIQQKATEMTISSGDSASFYVDAASISLSADETICFIVSLDGVPCTLHNDKCVFEICNASFSTVIYGTSSKNASTAITTSCSSDENGLSVDAVAGISVVLTLLVVLPVGVTLGYCGRWSLAKSRSSTSATGDGNKERRTTSVVYEEPVAPVFSLTQNRAYGQVAPSQRTS